MKPLRIYVSAACLVCDRTSQIFAEVRAQRPAYPVQIVDLDQPDAVKPPFVFGTPTYVLGERVVSLGNPTSAALIALLDAETVLQRGQAAHGADDGQTHA
jgi:hypothetical protein